MSPASVDFSQVYQNSPRPEADPKTIGFGFLEGFLIASAVFGIAGAVLSKRIISGKLMYTIMGDVGGMYDYNGIGRDSRQGIEKVSNRMDTGPDGLWKLQLYLMCLLQRSP